MRQARSAGQLPIRAQSGNSARPITGQQQQQQMMNSQRIMQGTNHTCKKTFKKYFKNVTKMKEKKRL